MSLQAATPSGDKRRSSVAGQSSAKELVKTIADARLWFEPLATGHSPNIDAIASNAGITASGGSRTIPLALLPPRIVAAIDDGRQQVDLTAGRLKRMRDIP